MSSGSRVPSIRTERLILTLPPPEAARRMLDYHERNREHFAPWSPPEPPGFRTEKYWRERLALNRLDYRQGRSLRLAIASISDPRGDILGECNFSQVFRGPFLACMLGYKIDRACEGQGLMHEALAAATAHVFQELRLHRIQAAYMPENVRSGRLLARLGFTIEGHAREYLFIAGAWRDHVLTSLTNRSVTAPEP